MGEKKLVDLSERGKEREAITFLSEPIFSSSLGKSKQSESQVSSSAGLEFMASYSLDLVYILVTQKNCLCVFLLRFIIKNDVNRNAIFLHE